MTPLNQARKRVTTNPLKTIADVRDAQKALALIDYLLTPVTLWKPNGTTLRRKPRCRRCKQTNTSLYQISGMWYCLDHIPTGTTFPIGLHGNEFKAYQERRK